MDNKNILVYVNVDEAGNLTEIYAGVNAIPSKDFSFFFRVDVETFDDIENYKVGIKGLEPALIKK